VTTRSHDSRQIAPLTNRREAWASIFL